MFKTFQVLTNLDCNLRCRYCYEYTKNRGKNNPDTVKKYLTTILNNEDVIKNIKETSIDFIGGESLLYPKELSEYIDLIISMCKEQTPNISLTTNGTLFNRDDVREFITTYGKYISLCISIDGIKKCHNLNRVDAHGNGSYDSIIEQLDFIKTYIPKCKLSVKATFNHDTIKYYKESYSK